MTDSKQPDTRQFDSTIKDRTQLIAAKRKVMDGPMKRFIQHSKAMMSQWADAVETRFQKDGAKVIQNLDPATLTALKADINDYKAHSDAIVEQELAQIQLWWHLQDFSVEPFESSSDISNLRKQFEFNNQRLPSAHEKALLRCTTPLANVFEKHGLEKGSRVYSHPYGTPDHLIKEMVIYGELFDECMKFLREIVDAKEERLRVFAKSRWDSA